AVNLGLDLRFIADVSVSRAFVRFHPFVGVRGGGLLRILSKQLLLDDQRYLILRPGDDVSLLPTVTGYVGGEYRIRRSWLVGLVGSFTYGTSSYYEATGSLELSWIGY
ncbi:MAG: hypothetical protein ACXWC5_22365, partial [Burkholderiales bacterium]